MKEKILVIDDDLEICHLLKDFLKKKDYSVITATSVRKGLELIGTEKPKIILLDVRMPEMDGIAAIHEIRKIDTSVGIVMITGYKDEESARKTIELGASDYILKPFDLAYLQKAFW